MGIAASPADSGVSHLGSRIQNLQAAMVHAGILNFLLKLDVSTDILSKGSSTAASVSLLRSQDLNISGQGGQVQCRSDEKTTLWCTSAPEQVCRSLLARLQQPQASFPEQGLHDPGELKLQSPSWYPFKAVYKMHSVP